MPKPPEPPPKDPHPVAATPNPGQRRKPGSNRDLDLNLALEGFVRWGDEVLVVP